MLEIDEPEGRNTTSITKKQISEEEKIELDVDALRKVLRNREWINLPVAIISVAGPFRTGKSFLLNSLHHIMTNIEKNSRNDLRELQKTIPNVFESKTGTNRHTTGIHILSKPFIVDSPGKSNTKMAVFLMDTQGLFDNVTSKQNETILGMLSFLLSSRQLFNVKNNIGSLHLEHIYDFAQKAQAIKMENENCKPIQAGSLMFVVRDFENEDEYDLGLDGGTKYVKTLLQNSNVAQDQAMLQDYMKSTYETIPCCLLPHPSKNVRKSSCSFSDLDEDFSTNIFKFFDFLLSGNKISSKAFQGKSISCGELATFLESYSYHDGFEAGVQSSILADAQALMSNLVNKIANDFISEATKYLKTCKDEDEEERLNGLGKLCSSHESKLNSEKPKWIKNADAWINELQRLLAQIGTALMACYSADEKYLIALKDFRSYLEQELKLLKNSDSNTQKTSAILNTKTKQVKLEKSLRDKIDPKIVDQCCESFKNDINKILAEEKEKVDNFFVKLEKNKGINTFLDIGRMVAGGFGVATGAALSLTLVGAVGGVPLIKRAWQYLKSGMLGANRKGRATKKGDLFTLPSNEFNLKKYESSHLSISLCFGEIQYPLSFEDVSN